METRSSFRAGRVRLAVRRRGLTDRRDRSRRPFALAGGRRRATVEDVDRSGETVELSARGRPDVVATLEADAAGIAPP